MVGIRQFGHAANVGGCNHLGSARPISVKHAWVSTMSFVYSAGICHDSTTCPSGGVPMRARRMSMMHRARLELYKTYTVSLSVLSCSPEA